MAITERLADTRLKRRGSNMKKSRVSLIAASALATALLASSPQAFAGNHGKDYNGKGDMTELCEQFREGKGKFSPENRKARMEERRAEADKRHAAMADRLELTGEQRKVWDEIRQERREKHEQRAARWQEKMAERCAAKQE
ncbi:hypothetical protein [Marinobacter pelagius]|uniref:Uncharacterized protein n=1 Tax=Marinobacter pelagius TaxID=379482 RepID=A0A1I4UW89_9GAMM|nr:hypothetical protein [Marinobacter pelagius]SFM93287.1 hypothetical protein SAMN04487961_1613 [Marinobacter pelagius]